MGSKKRLPLFDDRRPVRRSHRLRLKSKTVRTEGAYFFFLRPFFFAPFFAPAFAFVLRFFAMLPS
jgi:hypothetical protein